jgi:hypothetical protein
VNKYLSGLNRLLKALVKNPYVFARAFNTLPYVCSAGNYSRTYKGNIKETYSSFSAEANPLWDYFQNHREGHGIWKWKHYFDIYHRHFSRFIGKKVNILEIGVYSGGSLDMWRSYFGEDSHIYGIDIEDACKVYENDYVTIFIGDQADRAFWRTFRNKVEGIDILIDDGGHTPEQQQVTLEEMLPHLRPGGVYLCEDIQGDFNRFSAFAAGLVNGLNHINMIEDAKPPYSSISKYQASVHSIHFYPYIVVIEKHSVLPDKLPSLKHGTEWQPFLRDVK